MEVGLSTTQGAKKAYTARFRSQKGNACLFASLAIVTRLLRKQTRPTHEFQCILREASAIFSAINPSLLNREKGIMKTTVRKRHLLGRMVCLGTLGLILCVPADAQVPVNVDDLLATCPSAKEISSINRDFTLTFESDPSAGTLCAWLRMVQRTLRS